MGMFDYIVCKYKLPLPENLIELSADEIQNETFQTKDFVSSMLTYEIKKDGSLWVHKNEYEYKKGDPNSKSIFERIGQLEVIKSWEERLEYTGEVIFYTSIVEDEHKNDYVIDYKATFFKGSLVELNMIKFEVTDNQERINSWKKLQEKYKSIDLFINKWYIKIWYAPWRFFIKNTFSLYRSFLRKMPTNYKLERFLTPW